MSAVKRLSKRLDKVSEARAKDDDAEYIDYKMLPEDTIRDLLACSDDDGNFDLSDVKDKTLDDLQAAYSKKAEERER